MSAGLKIKVKGTMRELVRVQGECTQASLEHIGALWHNAIMPGHFTRAAVSRYHYANRSRKYMVYKGRKKGHQNPLVFTGESMRSCKSIRDVRATPKRVQVVMRAPALNFLAKRGMGRDELTAVDDRDANALGTSYAKDHARRLQKVANGTPREGG